VPTLLERLREQRATTRQRIDAILERAAHDQVDLTAEEIRAFAELAGQSRDLDDRLEEIRDQELAELRAGLAAARTSQERGMPSVSVAEPELDRTVRDGLMQRSRAPWDVTWSTPRTMYSPAVEQRSLVTTSGGGLTPTSFYDRLLMHLVETSAVIAAGATVITTTSGETLKVPKSSAFSTAAIVAEGQPIGSSDPTLGTVSLGAFKYAFLVQVSYELAQDSNFDLLGFLASQAAIAIANGWGTHAINGSGSGQPRGVIQDAAVGKTGPTGATGGFGTQTTAGQGLDLIYDLVGSLAAPYTQAPASGFLMATGTKTTLRKLRDGQSRYVWDGGLLAGAPVLVDPFVPAVALSAKSVFYGDWSRVYVRQVNSLRFERSDDYAFNADLATFRCAARLDSALVDTNAIKVFQGAAT
jgi:HK97 family phage major capsid protein